MNKNLTSETLLVAKEKEQGNPIVKVATGELNKNGTPKTASSRGKSNPDFLQIDRHGNALENFFSNFMRQCKKPTQFSFFKVPINALPEMASIIGDILKNGYESGKELLDEYRVKPEDYLQKQDKGKKQENGQAQQTEKKETAQTSPENRPTAISEDDVDWDSLRKLGINKEMLQKKNCLETMLNYGKSPLLPVRMNLEGINVNTQARLAFRKGDNNKLTIAVHGVRQQPEVDKPFYGHQFTEDEKKALLETGNLGKVLDLKKTDGSLFPIYVSVDKLTNEIVALRADKINIPDEIKGVRLDDKQKQGLQEGKAVLVENMTARSGKAFSALLQVNAEKRGLEFIFDNQALQKQQGIRIPSKLGGISLSEEQQADLKAEKTIYAEGLTDKKGEKYNAYIKVNPEKGKLDFYKWNPDKAQEKKPDNAHRTQEAVNSQGKTNEATKAAKEPLKPGQTNPNEKQEMDRQQKSKGKKIRV